MAGRASFGAIFDWDGVVVDSSAHHERAWERLAEERGRALPPDHFERGFGRKNEVIIPDILGWTRDAGEVRELSLRKEALYREELRRGGVALLPGVSGFVASLREAGVPCVVGSSSHRENVETALRALELDAFQALVTAEDVTLGKPDPEVFLVAADRIGVPPARCVVFEDVPAGIEAARRGGMKAVAVTTTHGPAALAAADRVVDRLDRLTVEALQALVDGARSGTALGVAEGRP